LAYKYVLLAVTLVTGLWLLLKGYRWAALHWLFGIIITIGIGFVSKHVLAVPRPEGILHAGDSFAFPSGHIVYATVLFLLLATFLSYHLCFEKFYQATQLIWPEVHVSEKLWWDQAKPDPIVYRRNRLGQPLQPLNLQWLGDLNQIETDLGIHGWQLIPKH